MAIMSTPSEPTPDSTKLEPASPQSTPTQPKPGTPRWRIWALLALALAIIGGGIWGTVLFFTKKNPLNPTHQASTSTKTKLVYMTHWTEDYQLAGLQKYLDEYSKLHPNIQFVKQVVKYDEYADKLKVLYDAGTAPDIYQIYSNWGVNYVKDDMLDAVPADVEKDVQQNYVSSTGATINGKLRGIPTEINDYTLLYNKDLFKAAGIVDAAGNPVAPKTWNDVVTDAAKLTKKDAKGNITQYGFAVLKDNDWQVVDPFLSLLYSNGGQYLSSDLSKSLFNSPAGVQALNAQLQLFKNGSTDLQSNFFDFSKGTVGMVVSPPWPKATFAKDFGAKFQSSVGVTPLPPLGTKQASLGYSWFMGVMNSSTHKQEAWDFLRWFTSDIQPSTGTTRYGDLLANVIGSIPSRKVDVTKHQDVLGDFFTKPFVDQLTNAQAEPNVTQSNTIKTTLMNEIQAAWSGQKTAQQALDAAAASIDTTLHNSSK